MGFAEVIFSLLIALVITAVFALGFNNKGPWGTIWAFFLIIFLAVWAATLWFTPHGPFVWGIAWIPVTIVGIVIALIISSAVPPSNRETIQHKRKLDPEVKQKGKVSTYSVYFWMVLLLLVIAIIVGYYIS